MVRKLPNTIGEPGRTSWLRAIPVMASAKAWAISAGWVTGPMAPPMMNGEITQP